MLSSFSILYQVAISFSSSSEKFTENLSAYHGPSIFKTKKLLNHLQGADSPAKTTPFQMQAVKHVCAQPKNT